MELYRNTDLVLSPENPGHPGARYADVMEWAAEQGLSSTASELLEYAVMADRASGLSGLLVVEEDGPHHYTCGELAYLRRLSDSMGLSHVEIGTGYTELTEREEAFVRRELAARGVEAGPGQVIEIRANGEADGTCRRTLWATELVRRSGLIE